MVQIFFIDVICNYSAEDLSDINKYLRCIYLECGEYRDLRFSVNTLRYGDKDAENKALISSYDLLQNKIITLENGYKKVT